jgi:hypothetical protein
MRNTLSTLPITLRLLRPNKASKHDDLIKIYRVDFEDDCYKVVYVDGDAETYSNKTVHESVRFLTGDEVDTYLTALFVLLTKDDDPFDKFQIQAPGFPCILLKVDELRKPRVREEILNVLPLLTNFWKE